MVTEAPRTKPSAAEPVPKLGPADGYMLPLTLRSPGVSAQATVGHPYKGVARHFGEEVAGLAMYYLVPMMASCDEIASSHVWVACGLIQIPQRHSSG